MPVYTFVDKTTKRSTDFPKLMISDRGAIVYFLHECCGTMLNSMPNLAPGIYARNWDMKVFEDFPGTITLRNKE